MGVPTKTTDSALAARPRFWRRVSKPVLRAGSCAVLLVVLFYAEEDWRGWHTWNQFKQAWEKQGEHFDLASVVPPAVPDEQNFAMTPIAFTSYGKVLTRAGKLIPEDQRDEAFLVRMRMPISVEDAGPTDCIGDWAEGTFTRLDCWQRHYRDLATWTNAFPVPAQPQSPAADVRLALGKYDDAIEELRVANRLPYSRFPANYDSESPMMLHVPYLAALKSCARLLQLRSLAELQDGQMDMAVDDVRLALQLTEKVRTEPLLISHLVRMAMVQLMFQPIWEGLAKHQWADGRLVELNSELAKLNFVADWKLSMRGELAGQTEEIQFLRRHPARFRELQAVIDFAGQQSTVRLPDGLIVRLMPAGWFYQNGYRCARIMENYFIPLADLARGTFSPALARSAEAALASDLNSVNPFDRYARLMLPVLGNAAKRFAYVQASVDLARTAVALERFRLAHGAFPKSLDLLAPRFIAKVPHDVIGGRPLIYGWKGDGTFVLYSVGWNETDDDGVADRGLGASEAMETDDWVWQYPSSGK